MIQSINRFVYMIFVEMKKIIDGKNRLEINNYDGILRYGLKLEFQDC